MLLRLVLEEFVIVERETLEFAPGLNVLTGETGAGKSILVDAIGFLAGGRASSDWVRHGASRLMVEGTVRPAPEGCQAASAGGIPLEEDGLLLLRREMGADGRSRCHANGRQVLVSQLRELTAGALWIVGQGEQRALVHPGEQEWVLDRFGRSLDLKERYREARERFLTARAALEATRREQESFAREEEWLRFQAREIREAELQPGEKERLLQERSAARAYQEEAGIREELEARLFRDEGSILDHLESLCHRLGQLEEDRWGEIHRVVLELRDSARELQRLLPSTDLEAEADPEAIEERLRLLDRLVRKYGARVEPRGAGLASRELPSEAEDEVLRHLEEVEARLAAGEALSDRVAQDAAALESLRSELGRIGSELSNRRAAAADRFSSAVASELDGLGMPGAALRFQLQGEPDEEGVPSKDAGALSGDAGAQSGETRLRPLESGLERVSLHLRSHPGEPEGELGRVASGGELSRILLAIHAALGEAGPPGCWVLDEVDQGIGGDTANRVAERLARMSRHAQVLLVTHLATIAARADRQLRVAKEERAGRPAVRVEVLSGEVRLGELARMLSGEEASPIARQHAQELLAAARKKSSRR